MSLIADALKRAQEQRAEGKGGKDRDDRARRMLSGPGTIRVQNRRGPRVPGSVVAAAVVLAVAIAGFGGVVLLTPSGDDAGAADAGAVAAAGEATPGQEASTASGEPAATVPDGTGDADAGAEPAGRQAVGARETGAFEGGAASPAGAGEAVDAPSQGAPPQRASAEAAGAGLAGVEPTGSGEASSFTLRLQGSAEQAAGAAGASELFGRALSAHQRGDLRGAVSLYLAAIERNPTDGQLHNNLGTVYRALSMPGEALASFRTAVAVAPSYAPAWSNLGLMLDGLGRDEEAIEAFREALRRDPSNAGARVNLANKYLGLGLVDDARSLLAGVLRDDPTLPEAHYAMARALEAAGEGGEAAGHYRTFLELADGQFPTLEARVREHLAGREGGGP